MSKKSKKKIYDFRRIEEKWIKEWDRKSIYNASEHPDKEKYYCLDTFVYPSGKGVTIGHYKSFGGMDVMARYKRMKGCNVLYPTGWDTFGLPAENFAIKENSHPKDITEKNKSNFIHQYKSAGLSYDWSREINTSAPEYYKWTQWLFCILYKKGLAYRRISEVDYCNECKTVISKEQIVDGACERCGGNVSKKKLKQWFFAITKYADRLDKNIDELDWDEKYKKVHRNWIGKKINDKGEIQLNLSKRLVYIKTEILGATYTNCLL